MVTDRQTAAAHACVQGGWTLTLATMNATRAAAALVLLARCAKLEAEPNKPTRCGAIAAVLGASLRFDMIDSRSAVENSSNNSQPAATSATK